MSHWRITAPASSDSEPEPRPETVTSGEEQYKSADDRNSPPASQTPVTETLAPALIPESYRQVTGL